MAVLIEGFLADDLDLSGLIGEEVKLVALRRVPGPSEDMLGIVLIEVGGRPPRGEAKQTCPVWVGGEHSGSKAGLISPPPPVEEDEPSAVGGEEEVVEPVSRPLHGLIPLEMGHLGEGEHEPVVASHEVEEVNAVVL